MSMYDCKNSVLDLLRVDLVTLTDGILENLFIASNKYIFVPLWFSMGSA